MFIVSLFQETSTALKNFLLLMLNYENGEKWNISLFVYIGSRRELIREFQTAVKFSNTICLWVAAN